MNGCLRVIYFIIMQEIWKDVVGYSEYQVSNFGNVKSKDRSFVSFNGRNRFFKSHLLSPVNSKGYMVVSLTELNNIGKRIQKLKKVHRLVAEAFIPNPQGKATVNHKNFIKSDNTVANLEWNTAGENTKYSYDFGITPNRQRGEANMKAKLSPSDVRYIRQWKSTLNIPTPIISKYFNVSNVTINAIARNQCWKHI